MAKQEDACSPENCTKDWAGDGLTLAAVWGFPAAAMLAATWLEPTLRAVVWAAMLIWMGGACVANARRCGRTHCRYTGPFFLCMAGLLAAYVTGIVPLGPHGWEIIALATLLGNGLIWWGSERLLGTFRRCR